MGPYVVNWASRCIDERFTSTDLINPEDTGSIRPNLLSLNLVKVRLQQVRAREHKESRFEALCACSAGAPTTAHRHKRRPPSSPETGAATSTAVGSCSPDAQRSSIAGAHRPIRPSPRKAVARARCAYREAHWHNVLLATSRRFVLLKPRKIETLVREFEFKLSYDTSWVRTLTVTGDESAVCSAETPKDRTAEKESR